MSARPLALIAAVAALALGAVACGDDDEDDTVSLPSISTVPETTATAPEVTTTPPATTTAPESGGAGTGAGRKDTAKNDTPPPAGTPQEAFEQFCEQNPGACGD